LKKPIAIYTSYNIRYPVGGHVLAELHYIVGLQRLGYEVIVIEESGQEWAPCFNPVKNQMSDDPSYGWNALRDLLKPHDLENNICYVDGQRRYHGIEADRFRQLCREATVLFSRAGVNWLPEFAECRRRLFVDTDPGFTQFKLKPEHKSCSGFASPYDFDTHFSYGERIGRPDCPIPTCGLTWHPTRPPVVLDLVEHRFTPDAKYFTTVMSWSSRKPIVFEGEEYGQKDMEFRKVMNLPARAGRQFEIAMAGNTVPRAEIEQAGWVLADATAATQTVEAYRDYIAQSRGEFSVAVNLEVKARSGWFSDRTAAYLAAGKPVVVQDTGFSEFLPCGRGLFAFATEDDAAAAVEAVNSDYAQHCRTAREIAGEHFEATKLIREILTRADLVVE
jgi:hypothetical protein